MAEINDLRMKNRHGATIVFGSCSNRNRETMAEMNRLLCRGLIDFKKTVADEISIGLKFELPMIELPVRLGKQHQTIIMLGRKFSDTRNVGR